jgi:serine/threonine protein kinase
MGKRLMAALLTQDRLEALRAALTETASPRLRQAVSDRAGRFPEWGWTVSVDGFWAHARPAGPRPAGQGWKIHVSAVPEAAEVTLARCAEILLPAGVPFKFAQDLAVVIMLVSARGGSGGKFLTVYPRTTAQFGRVIAQLADAVAGLPGPPVGSDARYRPGSPVYYRYGVFGGQEWLTDDGRVTHVLRAPDGTAVIDDRSRFRPPAWAPPLPWLGEGAVVIGQSPPTLARLPVVDGRFQITEVLTASVRGGVFGGAEIGSGRRVIIKRAVRNVGAASLGEDAQAAARHEAEVLAALASTGVVPPVVCLIEQPDSTLLICERVPGDDLRTWVRRGWDPRRGSPPGAPLVAERLAAAVAAVHAAGYVLRDLSPSNVIVTPRGDVRLVDLELAARPGTLVPAGHTPGYAAPGQLTGPAPAPAPGPEADRYALGALLFFLATAADPVMVPDESQRTAAERAAERLALLPIGHAFAHRVSPLVSALMAGDPASRPFLGWVRERLETSRAPTPARRQDPGERHDTARQLLDDGLRHLLAQAQPDDPRQLWSPAPWRGPRDPSCVDYGAAGPLLVLARAAGPGAGAGLLTSARLADLAGWLARRTRATPRVLPGLGSGRSGVLWVLWEAAARTGDEALARWCLGQARQLPADTGIPGLAHGVAGAGLLTLHLWADTHDPELRTQATCLVDRLLAEDATRGGPDAAVGGLARGEAGTAWFLLHAGRMLGHGGAVDRAAATARAASRAVAAAVGRGDVTEPGDLGLEHGAAGVGRLLVAAASLLGHEESALAAATITGAFTGWEVRAPCGLGQGIAGWGEFLLDCAHQTGDRAAARLAGELVPALAARAGRAEGRRVVPDDSGAGYASELIGGVAGVVWFLHRLTTGVPGLWLPGGAGGQAVPA